MWLIRALIGVALVALAGLFSLAFYYRYWLWRDCFNELGRCYDPVGQDVYLEQAGIVWGGLAILSLATGLALILSKKGRGRGIY